MKRVICFALALSALCASCAQAGNGGAAKAEPVKLVLDGVPLEAADPLLVQGESIYLSCGTLVSLPGVTAAYEAATGKITVSRQGLEYVLKVGEPFSEKPDKNAPVPFVKQGAAYVPLKEVLTRLSYDVQVEKGGGPLVVSLRKIGFDYSDAWVPFSKAELAAAEQALARGVSISDPRDDWAPIKEGIQPDGRSDNGEPYPLPFTDIKSVSFGADGDYFYLRCDFGGILPAALFHYQNPQYSKDDFIKSICVNADVHFFNRNTGKDDGGLMQTGPFWVQGDDRQNSDNPMLFTPPIVSLSNFATANGADKNGELTYAVANSHGRVGGGAGTSYVLAAFPLKEYGLQLGDTLELGISAETNSKLFHHEAIDVLLDCGLKAGETIRYALGASTWENLGPPKL